MPTSPRRARLVVAPLLALALPLTLTSLASPTSARVSDSRVVTAAAQPAAPRVRVENPALPQNPDNPLANRHWAVYTALAELSWPPYVHAHGKVKRDLGYIALKPKSTWFGRFVPNSKISTVVRRYISNSLRGHSRNSLVQMTMFRVDPWEHDACHSLPTVRQQRAYKVWINRAARAIGRTHVALVLQPDGPFALCAPHRSLAYSHLVGYAAKRFGSLPHTSVYIDAGADDWLRDNPATALRILLPAGIRYARGFALNSTHYSSTHDEVRFAAKVAQALARHGFKHKYAVIDTAQNGRPFKGYTFRGRDFENAPTCRSRHSHRCVTLGIPPTLDVANPKWGLDAATNRRAARYVDAYLWFGRPWLIHSTRFGVQRALQVIRSSPYRCNGLCR